MVAYYVELGKEKDTGNLIVLITTPRKITTKEADDIKDELSSLFVKPADIEFCWDVDEKLITRFGDWEVDKNG